MFGITKEDAQRLLLNLSDRQTEIAEALAFGEETSKIWKRLKIARGTFYMHLAQIRKRLGLGKEFYGVGRIWFAAHS